MWESWDLYLPERQMKIRSAIFFSCYTVQCAIFNQTAHWLYRFMAYSWNLKGWCNTAERGKMVHSGATRKREFYTPVAMRVVLNRRGSFFFLFFFLSFILLSKYIICHYIQVLLWDQQHFKELDAKIITASYSLLHKQISQMLFKKKLWSTTSAIFLCIRSTSSSDSFQAVCSTFFNH